LAKFYDRRGQDASRGQAQQNCKTKTYRTLGALTKPNRTTTETAKESYALVMSEHFPDATTLDDAASANPDPAPMQGRYNHPILVDQPSWINVERLREALHSFGNNKAAGPDDIKPIILHNMPEIEHTLKRLYAAIIDLHYTPSLWRRSEIVFIPKPGKDQSYPRAYRPILLMSFLFKTLERLVQWGLEETAYPRASKWYWEYNLSISKSKN
jgi:hypothetical protein